MEEIDIIELLIRERQDKAPKRIEINGKVYIHTLYSSPLGIIYVEESNMSKYWKINDYTIDTGISILDEPIIEELDENENVDIYELARKVNQIIRHIKKEEK